MKKAMSMFVVAILIVSAAGISLSTSKAKAQTVKILYEQSRIVPAIDAYLESSDQKNFRKAIEELGFEIEGNKKGDEITSEVLENYQVLIVAPLIDKYTSGEIRAIQKFVKNGGGLLILSENPVLDYGNNEGQSMIPAMNKLANKFGINFPFCQPVTPIQIAGGVNYAAILPTKGQENHPINQGLPTSPADNQEYSWLGNAGIVEVEGDAYLVQSLAEGGQCTGGEPMASNQGGVAVRDYGKGHVVGNPDASMFTIRIKGGQNKLLLQNIIRYLATPSEEAVEEEPGEKPGGEVPAEEITPEQVQTALDEAKTAIDKGKAKGVDMSEAEALLAEAEGMSESDPAGAIETAGEVPALVDELIQYGAEEVKDLLTDMEELFREAEDANAEKNAPDLYNEAKSLRDQAQSALANGEIGKAKDIAKQAEQKITDATEKAKEAEAAKMRTQSTIIWIIVGVLVIVLIVVGKKYMKSPEE